MKTTHRRGKQSVAVRIGEAIRFKRRQLGMTLQILGDLSGIDVSQLSKVERGVGATSLPTLERILYELGLTMQLVRGPARQMSKPNHHDRES